MRKSTLNFIKENEDGTKSCDFKLNAYTCPENITIDKWSNRCRALFLRERDTISKQLENARKTSVLQAQSIILNRLSEAAGYAGGAADWGSVHCAVPINYVLWLACLDHREDAVKRNIAEAAALLSSKTMAAYDKVRCPPMTSWPITKKCYGIIKENKVPADMRGNDLQVLLTAYACALSERNGLTDREHYEHGLSTAEQQDMARRTAAALMGIVYPRWTIYRGKLASNSDHSKEAILRTAVMPVTTGITRTFTMVSMPLDMAAITMTDLLASAWPLSARNRNVPDAIEHVARLFSGMACTVAATPIEAIEKTCYVWTRYLW